MYFFDDVQLLQRGLESRAQQPFQIGPVVAEILNDGSIIRPVDDVLKPCSLSWSNEV